MSILTKQVAALGLVAALGVISLTPAMAGAIGTGAASLSAAVPNGVTQVQYWGPRYGYGRGGCWNCGRYYNNNNNGAAVGAGIALGILGAAAIAGAASAPPPPPPVYYAPPPPALYAPAPPVVYAPQARGGCWFPTDTHGNGYWGAC
ncbi:MULTISPECIES: hypothetical protein [Roseixanthobacter]|uniref:hypothetical protein n=1 Tax=Xanthobacteraceae TaxID=335928 RepID=UPI0026C2A7EF|nr:hypothetical protein [Xanthobacteraceae bacterium]HQS50040.1 hypothetical protein [Xanthobacteraceae bacterium]